jgi:chromosome segregation ATPase
MTDQVADTNLEAPVSEQASEAIPAAQPTPEDVEATWRKRQAGADAARAAAEKELAEARKELAVLRQVERETQDASLSETAKLQANLEAAERRANEAEAKATAKYLDRVFPKARTRFPEITDEVRLAELEALYSDAPAPAKAEAPTDDLRSMRAPRDASAAKPADETPAAGWERFKASVPVPDSWRRLGSN